jgi:hypothetical protein
MAGQSNVNPLWQSGGLTPALPGGRRGRLNRTELQGAADKLLTEPA